MNDENIPSMSFDELAMKLKDERFYGETVQIWVDGEVILMTVSQKFKPKDFHKIVEKKD